MENDFLLIGIDGGATKVNACHVLYKDSGKSFSLSETCSELFYLDLPGYLTKFKPVDIKKQLEELKNNEICPSLNEKHQEAVIVEACCKTVLNICKKLKKYKALLGIGLPGLKTNDKRGIAAMNNGPRMIRFSQLLEERLAMESIELVQSVKELGSDADYCGIGENYAENGLLKDTQNVYYLGGGTGVADAIKLDGQLVPFDKIKSWMAKSWEMQWSDGISMEKYVSAQGILGQFARLNGLAIDELKEQGLHASHLVDLARRGDRDAKTTFKKVSEPLAALIFERIQTLYAGWQDTFKLSNPQRKITDSDHPHRSKVFDRIVLGQRLGQILSTEGGFSVLGKPMLKILSEKIQNCIHFPDKVKHHYRDLDKIIQFSTLRDAPALGAGIDAYFSYTGERV
ncbi:MAG: ROK family protein [Calditrichaceae bacterium]|nr:ROK family protein [Calditrichaceae bacterium]MBN2709950.1 ROK family protein [Calditrichaceae bacterium]RQV92700.1 MAG: ROK family protein [Calditrichota bacterium]